MNATHMRVHAIERTNVDDATFALRAHVRERFLHRPQRTHDIHVPRVVHGVIGHLVNTLKTGLIATPCIVDEDVDGTPARNSFSHHAAVVFFFRCICVKEECFDPKLVLKFLSHCRPGFAIDVGDNNSGAFLRKATSDTATDPVTPTGNYCNSIEQSFV